MARSESSNPVFQRSQPLRESLGGYGPDGRPVPSEQDVADIYGAPQRLTMDDIAVKTGILLGLPRAVSAELIIQSAVGAAIMLRDSGEHPTLLREAVTSPGGTTIAAIRELENHGVRAALLSAIEAAALRSADLGRAHDGN